LRRWILAQIKIMRAIPYLGESISTGGRSSQCLDRRKFDALAPLRLENPWPNRAEL
jgi:hypothetical protein